MDKFFTMAEIRPQFDGEWILITDPETDEFQTIQGGKLVWHSKHRDEVYRKLLELRPGRSAVLYTGHLPADTAIML